MNDPRGTLANPRVAATELAGRVTSGRFVDGTTHRITTAVADLCSAPGGARERQLLYGQSARVLEVHEGWAFAAATRDGFVGYISAAALGDELTPTHRVAVPATHLYPVPNLKRREAAWLSFGSELRVVSASGAFFETSEGFFVPKPHLRPLNAPFVDPVTVAQLHFGMPYLWGGNSSAGVDCSGLVQAGCLAAGIPCPGDSDQQEAALGETLLPGTPPQRGDLYFWEGHVAWAVDGETLIHANAYAMAVSYEPIAEAIARIAAQGDGVVTRRARLRPTL